MRVRCGSGQPGAILQSRYCRRGKRYVNRCDAATLASDAGCRVEMRDARSTLQGAKLLWLWQLWGNECASLHCLTSHNVYGRVQVERERVARSTGGSHGQTTNQLSSVFAQREEELSLSSIHFCIKYSVKMTLSPPSPVDAQLLGSVRCRFDIGGDWAPIPSLGLHPYYPCRLQGDLRWRWSRYPDGFPLSWTTYRTSSS